MLSLLCALSLLTLLVHATVLSRGDPGFQHVPARATTPDNKFNIGSKILKAQPPHTDEPVPAIYGPRSVCLHNTNTHHFALIDL